ncbi:MAG TPA: response regulator transcription factor, partial [Chitinophagaceae bacterium]|nr:response regulator transcription factor [Chitinophagaceae bacterium]
PFIYLVDYTTGNYLFLEESCQDLLGYPQQYLLETGHRGYYDKVHPTDRVLLLNKVFPDIFKFLKHLPLDRYNDFIVSINYRFMNAKREYMTLIQKHSYVPGNSMGNPSGTVGIIYDITHFKNDLSIVHTIEEIIPYNNETARKLVFKKAHPVYEKGLQIILSKREKDVLKCIADGLGSKQIASKLSISNNTVNNHRKNMLNKTGCKSSVELLNYALKHGFY